ncbi:MAG: hypothetical protein UR26_C0005G0057 [candidate division TM6 bacterium GW2011_GWF2_32_72]|nr:MAG: hypothetical protein UR26_C0005G0057 [candidate division TM6 bacterium GW2011_GWF2_32_72]
MQIVQDKISVDELKQMSKKMFGNLVKAVVDIDKEIMAIDAELHADQENFLLESGSLQKNLWGINLYPDLIGDENWIEFDSMINLRPSSGNLSRGINDKIIQDKIKTIVNKLVK